MGELKKTELTKTIKNISEFKNINNYVYDIHPFSYFETTTSTIFQMLYTFLDSCCTINSISN
jgi:hypothetical protein